MIFMQVMSLVRELRAFNANLNRSLGIIYVNFFITTLCYYSGTPANLRKSTITKSHWYKGVYFFMSWTTWIWSCEFHRKIQEALRSWIREHKYCSNGQLTQMDIGKMNLLAMEIEHDAMGIVCRYFTVNYSLLFSLLGLLVTYSILAYQV
ncbi:hypothetical protein Ocin01_00114 [Orchesella cincta]|uniref:Uncharacterized protein n=1 Tax=Orchesella cincta TaxID=48709 RepID=A0A1D2NMT5_ORCCI|nr:hypothetical protein Ocin01_00114 [Orchesella cincta]